MVILAFTISGNRTYRWAQGKFQSKATTLIPLLLAEWVTDWNQVLQRTLASANFLEHDHEGMRPQHTQLLDFLLQRHYYCILMKQRHVNKIKKCYFLNNNDYSTSWSRIELSSMCISSKKRKLNPTPISDFKIQVNIFNQIARWDSGYLDETVKGEGLGSDEDPPPVKQHYNLFCVLICTVILTLLLPRTVDSLYR